jgi:hypothetical protein
MTRIFGIILDIYERYQEVIEYLERSTIFRARFGRFQSAKPGGAPYAEGHMGPPWPAGPMGRGKSLSNYDSP